MDVVEKNGFYYLSCSFRKKGKVVNRQKYIGKDIPKEIGDIKERFLRQCMKEGLFVKLDKIKREYEKEWKRYPDSVKKKIMQRIAIEITFNTNAIEGSTITLEETEDLIKREIAPNKSLRDIKETLNHAKVFFSIINGWEKLTNMSILKWHTEIFGETKKDIAGMYRDYLVRVGDYVAPDWQDIKQMMKGFFRWYNKNKKIMHPVELAARAHYKFEKIHPFGDGNGRIGRLITAYILSEYDYPILIIEYSRRNYYYKALSKTENEFLGYFTRRYVSFFKHFLR